MKIDLRTPTDHHDPYIWAAVLLAHAGIGATLWIALEAVGWPYAVTTVIVAYMLFWEVAVQSAGAGLLDSFIDWLGVSAGVLVASGLYAGSLALPVAAGVALWVTLGVGMARRL